jgi:hypothetical protein
VDGGGLGEVGWDFYTVPRYFFWLHSERRYCVCSICIITIWEIYAASGFLEGSGRLDMRSSALMEMGRYPHYTYHVIHARFTTRGGHAVSAV